MQDFGLRKKKSVQNSLDACIVTINKKNYFLILGFLLLLELLVFVLFVVSWAA